MTAPVAVPVRDRRDAGLTSVEVERRRAISGPNVTIAARPASAWRRLAAQLSDPLNVVLLCAIALTVATGDHSDAVVGFQPVAA